MCTACRKRQKTKSLTLVSVLERFLSLQQTWNWVGGCVVCLDIAEVIISHKLLCFELFEFAAVNILIEACIAPSLDILGLTSESFDTQNNNNNKKKMEIYLLLVGKSIFLFSNWESVICPLVWDALLYAVFYYHWLIKRS